MKWCWCAVIGVAMGCGGAPEGYDRVGDGVHLRLLELGDGQYTAADADSVLLGLRIHAAADPRIPLFEGAHWYAVADLRGAAFDPPFGRMHAGDRAHLIAERRHIPWHVLRPAHFTTATDTSRVLVSFDLLAIRTPEEMSQAAALMQEEIAVGRRAISNYLRHATVDWQRWGNSMFHYRIEGRATDTARVRAGDPLVIAYEGRRLVDSVLIDDSRMHGQDFAFRFGDADQVVEGLEVAVSLLREGETGHFIIPGEMAFGARGVSGSLAPYEPVLYKVRLLRVERGPVTTAR